MTNGQGESRLLMPVSSDDDFQRGRRLFCSSAIIMGRPEMGYTGFHKMYKDFQKFAFAVLMIVYLTVSGIPHSTAQGNEPIHMVVVGDSVVWGQGLETRDKFYRKAADW